MSTARFAVNQSLSGNVQLEARKRIDDSLDATGIAILPPMDVIDSIRLMKFLGINPTMTMLDPWYNKGVGGVRSDYKDYIVSILKEVSDISNHVYLWGFPEIVAAFMERFPESLNFVAWLTWYYKNNPSVIRGWRSAQMACLHFARNGAKLYPQHFLNEAQLQKQAEGKLRYMPGPPSVIDVPLNIGFVGKKEQTGHPAQKPKAVFEPLIRMTTVPGDVIYDPMSGSGTTAEAAQLSGRRAIISDLSEEYTQIAEARLKTHRVILDTNYLLTGYELSAKTLDESVALDKSEPGVSKTCETPECLATTSAGRANEKDTSSSCEVLG